MFLFHVCNYTSYQSVKELRDVHMVIINISLLLAYKFSTYLLDACRKLLYIFRLTNHVENTQIILVY